MAQILVPLVLQSAIPAPMTNVLSLIVRSANNFRGVYSEYGLENKLPSDDVVLKKVALGLAMNLGFKNANTNTRTIKTTATTLQTLHMSRPSTLPSWRPQRRIEF
jgi:hypothetical protein